MVFVNPVTFVEFIFFIIGSFQDEMQVGGALSLPIIHILAHVQLKVLKLNFSQIMAKSISNDENVGSKTNCGG